jgi:hypothetical protein
MSKSIKTAESNAIEQTLNLPTKAMFQKALDNYISTMRKAEFFQIDRYGCSIFGHWETNYPETLVCGISIGSERMGSGNPKSYRIVSTMFEANQDEKPNTKETKECFIHYCSPDNCLAEHLNFQEPLQNLPTGTGSAMLKP